MDAPPDTSVMIEPTTEAFSGLPLLRVTGYWQGPTAAERPVRVEVRYDGATATRGDLMPATAADVPPDFVRLNFGTQLPAESPVREIAVVLVFAAGEREIARRPADALNANPPVANLGFVGRAARSEPAH